MSVSSPDYSRDGENNSGVMIVVSAVLGILCLVVVSARLYTRAILLRNAGLDDLLILLTQIVASGQNISTILEAYWGVGRHSWLASPEDAQRQLKSLFASIQLYIWALALVKFSLLCQYRRIFPAQWLQRTTLCIIGFACAWNIAQSILVTFGCVPLSEIYPSMADKCIDSLTIWYIAAGINITTDFIVFALPIPLINSLQLPSRQKVLLIMVFCLGFFTCIISIVRATTLYLVIGKDDPSWYGYYAAVWSMVEVNCAILCACLPTIRHLLALLLPCLGLRSEVSQYLEQHQLSSRSRSRRRGSFVLSRRGRKSHLPPTLRLGGGSGSGSGNKTIGGSSDHDAVMTPHHLHHHHHHHAAERDSGAAGLETRWDGGVDFEKPGLYYHSNQISAWISASPGSGGGSGGGSAGTAAAGGGASALHAKSRRRSDDESSDVQRLVSNSTSDRDLSQHILVTKETVITEENRTARTSVSELDSGRRTSAPDEV